MDNNIIESFEYYDYKPPISEDINHLGYEFPINAYNEDIITQPHKSLLVINGQVKLQTGTPPVPVPKFDYTHIDFVNNGILHIFDRIDYFIGDNKIDSVRKPGITGHMKGLASLKPNKAYSLACWKVNAIKTGLINNEGYFSVVVPLSLIMGFFEDYKQFLYRIPQKLIFCNSTTSVKNCFYSSQTGHVGSLTIKDITWRIPQVKFCIAYETQVRKEILKGTSYELFFRHWLYQSISPPVGTTEYTWDLPVSYSKTKYFIIGFQNNRQDNLQVSNDKFDLLDLESVQVLLNNNVYYPRERLNLKYSEHKCGNLYQMYKSFMQSYYNNTDDDPLVDYDHFLSDYPIIVIDCSHQPSVIKESLISIKILFNWREPLQDKTTVHCVTIVDHKAVYNPLSNTVIH